jgi:hypothetical protein
MAWARRCAGVTLAGVRWLMPWIAVLTIASGVAYGFDRALAEGVSAESTTDTSDSVDFQPCTYGSVRIEYIEGQWFWVDAYGQTC